LLSRRQVDLSAIERNPKSTVQRDALRETLADSPDAVDQELLDAAEQLTDAVAADEPRAAEVVGVDLKDVRAGFIQVRSISSTGVGFRGAGLIVDGGLDIGDVQAGRSGADAGPSQR